MSSLSASIQRSMYMDMKGHKTMVVECRDIKSDRAIIAKINKVKSVTKEPEVVTSLYTILGGV